MPAIGAFGSYPNRSKRKRKVICNHEQLAQRCSKVFQQLHDRDAAVVHVCQRLDENEVFSRNLFRRKCIFSPSGPYRCLETTSQLVDNLKSNIVSCSFIVCSWVSKPDGNDGFHGDSWLFLLLFFPFLPF